MVFFASTARTTSTTRRGTYFDLLEQAPGPVVADAEGLFAALADLDGIASAYAERLREFVGELRRVRPGRRRGRDRRPSLRCERGAPMTGRDIFFVCNRSTSSAAWPLVAPDGAAVGRAGPPGARHRGRAGALRWTSAGPRLPDRDSACGPAEAPAAVKDGPWGQLNVVGLRRDARRTCEVRKAVDRLSELFRAARPGGW